MSTAIFIPVSEYLASSYRPDREYVDGALLERNAGEWDHSRLQALLLKALLPYEETAGLLVAPELRVQVRASRFRVPDLCVLAGKPDGQILTRPPLLAIEVLSPEDSLNSMQARIDDYVDFGIANIWIFDPRNKKAYWADAAGVHESADRLRTHDAAVSLELNPLWAAM